MVQPRLRSRTKRRVYVKTPGGKTKIHYRERKPSPAVCAVTGERLHGVPREVPSKVGKLPKSRRRPSRPFGGVLSGKAMRSLLKKLARKE